MINSTTNSTVGQNSYFTGTFYIKASLRIDGFFEGKSLEVDQLYVGETGRIKSNDIIIASNLIVEGLIIGNITAKKRVMLMPTAKVLGDIRTPELIIQNGVVLEGRCIISKQEQTSVKSIIEEEYKKNFPSLEKLFPSYSKNLSNLDNKDKSKDKSKE